MNNGRNKYHTSLEIERIETAMGLQRLRFQPVHDPVSAQSRLQLQAKLHRVEAALTRLKTEAYGMCQNCGAPISAERLEAMPYVELCIACQRQLEKQTIGPRHIYQHSYR